MLKIENNKLHNEKLQYNALISRYEDKCKEINLMKQRHEIELRHHMTVSNTEVRQFKGMWVKSEQELEMMRVSYDELKKRNEDLKNERNLV